MKIVITVVAFCIFLGTLEAHSQRRTTSQPKRAVGSKAVTVHSKFDLKPFDTATQTLASQYSGHDPEAIFEALIARKDTAIKSEYETTEQFRRRMLQLDNVSLVGGLTTKSIFAFSTKGIETSYDADTQNLGVFVELKNVVEGGLTPLTEYETRRSVKSPNRAVEILDRLASRKYIATNAFVVKAQVQEIESDNFLLEIINWSAFNPTAFVPESFRALYEESMRGGNAALISSANTLWRKDAFHLSLKANPSEARKIRNNLRVLFVGEIREPFVAASSQETKATVTKPNAFKNRHYYLKVNLSEIWVYDFTTGTVYERLKNTSAVSANSEELTVSRADVEAFRKSAKENQIEMEVAILIADLEQTIAKFAADDYKLVTVSNAKGLLDDATRLNKGLSELETRLSEGAVKENLKAATLMINIASALLIEAGGTRVLSDQVRSDILNSRDLAKMPVAERPKTVMAGASRLWAAFQKALAQVGQ